MPVSRPTRSAELERLLLSKLEALASTEGRLPPELDLAAQFDVSRGTMRAAIGSLVARSLLIRRPGKGTYLNRIARIGNPLDNALDFCEIIAHNGYRPGRRYVRAEISRPDADVAQALDLPAEQPVVYRHTIFTADDAPVIYCIDAIPVWVLTPSLAEEVVRDPSISEPMYDFLEGRCGHRVDFYRAAIWPEIAQACPMIETICDPQMPVLVMRETGFDLSQRPIQHAIEYYPGRFMRFELVRRR